MADESPPALGWYLREIEREAATRGVPESVIKREWFARDQRRRAVEHSAAEALAHLHHQLLCGPTSHRGRLAGRLRVIADRLETVGS